MNLTPDTELLVDGYIDEVCVNLPKGKRADIAVEIRSLILDALEARSQDPDAEPDEAMVIAALRELGSPLEMASAYEAHNYVIGPQMYAPFWMTVRGVLLFMGFFYVLAFFLSWREATGSGRCAGLASRSRRRCSGGPDRSSDWPSSSRSTS